MEGVRPMETILAALITGAVTLIGVLIANGKSQAVTDTKLEELTREVRAHNNFAQRVPVLEEQMKVANHRINQLLSALGKPVLPIESAQLEQLISTGFTTVSALVNWWYNNSFTPEAIEADAFMARMKKRVR